MYCILRVPKCHHSFSPFFLNPAPVVAWDSQVKDGYKRSQVPAADGSESDPTRAAPVAGGGETTGGVVEELLRNSTDKAYGANGETRGESDLLSSNALAICSTAMDLYTIYRFALSCLVLSWDGEASAISRDAAQDVRHAKCDTVIDEWDEDFDRGKVRGGGNTDANNVILNQFCFPSAKAEAHCHCTASSTSVFVQINR